MSLISDLMRRSLEDIYRLVLSGNVHAFYVSGEWKKKRIDILKRDNYTCQRCLGRWTHDGKPIKKIRLTRAKYVHHIKPMKDYFELALEDSNLISLCFKCHEIVEGRQDNQFKRKKDYLTEEKW